MNREQRTVNTPALRRRLRCLSAIAALGALFVASVPLPAAPPSPEISYALSAKLEPLRNAIDSKDNAAALAVLAELLPATRTDSYDRFALLQIQAQLFLTQSDWSGALSPLENLLALDAAHSIRAPGETAWLAPAMRRDVLHTLAQVHYTLAADLPPSAAPAERRARYQRALDHARQAAANPSLLTPDIQAFLASLSYAAAFADPAAPDNKLLAGTVDAARHGLTLTVTPRQQFYLLLIAAYQQLGDHAAAAENLELLVQLAPGNKTHWSQLAGAWLNVAADAASREPARPSLVRSARLRAVNAIERGQQHGAFDTARDNQNLVSLYLNLGSPEHAISLLKSGLAEGRIENSRNSWELLILAYQQINNTREALLTCEAAASQFPADGNLDLQASQLLHQDARPEEALASVRSALAKGNLDKPGLAHTWHAWLAFELMRLDEAAAALDRAASFPDARPGEISRLRESITAGRNAGQGTKTLN